MQAKYTAKKPFKYGGKVIKPGQEWTPEGNKFDEAIKMHLVNLEVTKRQTRRKKADDGASSK